VLAGLLAPNSKSNRLISHLYPTSEILLSIATIAELEDVFRRPKFDRYQDVDMRLNFLWSYLEAGKTIEVTDFVADCRDPKDNKFLELALSGMADFIITGDTDLLSLHPWRGIAILSPAEYLERIG
jgi:putative PIN family toxin of toxin-antitoxin system